jgi:hypothetical protein
MWEMGGSMPWRGSPAKDLSTMAALMIRLKLSAIKIKWKGDRGYHFQMP